MLIGYYAKNMGLPIEKLVGKLATAPILELTMHDTYLVSSID